MDIVINNSKSNIDMIKLQKMAFIYNALEKGWRIQKKKPYIFLQKNMKVRKKFTLIHISNDLWSKTLILISFYRNVFKIKKTHYFFFFL